MKIENQDYAAGSTNAVDYLLVNEFSGGIVGPSQRMLGPLKNGGTLKTGTPPDCWGPMITLAFQGGHEVTLPVFIEGAEVGDAVALKIKKMKVTSIATSSGVMSFVEDAIRCKNCDAEVSIMHKNGITRLIKNGLIII